MAPVAEGVGPIAEEPPRIAVDVEEDLLEHIVGVHGRSAPPHATLDRVEERVAVELEQHGEHLGVTGVLVAVHQARADGVEALLIGFGPRHPFGVAPFAQSVQIAITGFLPEIPETLGERLGRDTRGNGGHQIACETKGACLRGP